jgi:hypothetical protein
MTATIVSFTTRFGTEAWAVTWGKGITQSAIADSYEEAVGFAARRSNKMVGSVEPLVRFRSW